MRAGSTHPDLRGKEQRREGEGPVRAEIKREEAAVGEEGEGTKKEMRYLNIMLRLMI